METYKYTYSGFSGMKKIISWLVPRERKFLDMLSSQSEDVLGMTKKLKDFIENYPKLERKDKKAIAYSIKDMNARTEEFGNNLMRKLSSDSIHEREEMRRVAMLLNEIADLASDCAMKFIILGIERIDSHTSKLAALFIDSTEELVKIISVKKPNSIKSHYDRLKSLKFEAEEAYNEALSELFHFYKNSIDIMKYREIYELLKNGVKKCTSAAEALDIMKARY